MAKTMEQKRYNEEKIKVYEELLSCLEKQTKLMFTSKIDVKKYTLIEAQESVIKTEYRSLIEIVEALNQLRKTIDFYKQRLVN